MSARRVIAGIGDLPLGQVKRRGTRGVRMDWRGLHGAFPARGDAARRAAPVRGCIGDLLTRFRGDSVQSNGGPA